MLRRPPDFCRRGAWRQERLAQTIQISGRVGHRERANLAPERGRSAWPAFELQPRDPRRSSGQGTLWGSGTASRNAQLP
ncbi:hypothetical protein BX600DRAFT_262426 [Xylariales sp. PMI_506]|nr:hypothetical protein BX600DRAFT_262426 [Xylariales sp. PMI_506]